MDCDGNVLKMFSNHLISEFEYILDTFSNPLEFVISRKLMSAFLR